MAGYHNPDFTVVIPTFNQAEFLREALTSVLQQTHPCFEVLVIDNHSSDDSVDVVRSFRDSRIHMLQIHNHGVIAASRNRGIDRARAPLVAFLDSDDAWQPEKLERVAQVWRDRPEVGLVCHDESVVRGESVVGRLRYGPSHQDMYRFLLLNGCRLSTSATVVRREHLELVGGFSEDPRLAGVEDYDLWLRLAGVCRFYFLHETLGRFRIHHQSHSSNVARHLDGALYLLNLHFESWEQNGAPLRRRVIRRRRAAAMRGAGHALMKQGDHAGAGRYLRMALREAPMSGRTWVLGLLNTARLRI